MSKDVTIANYKELRTIGNHKPAARPILQTGALSFTRNLEAPTSNVLEHSQAAESAQQNTRTLTTSELIAELQQIESSYGNLPVCLELKTTIHLRDDASNPVNTMAASVAKCEISEVHQNCNARLCNGTMMVWLNGQTISAIEQLDEL